MKYQRTLILSASCLLIALLCSIVWGYQKDKYLTERIAPKILRFHVLANSNSSRDQQLKAQVKSLILKKLKDCPADSKEDLCAYIEENKETLEAFADTYLQREGCSYRTSIQITKAYFPTKSYGSLVLPCGTYDTVQVELGAGRGRNWWCVLYPRLCFIEETRPVFPETSVEELKALLSEEDCRSLMNNPPTFHIRLKLLELLSN
ncbi:MAG: stage II sporulation protein R [Hungatella sp.]|jgi:stage II sporulation protein R|nr:stage II sporulation protein R [Hungatella sp.]